MCKVGTCNMRNKLKKILSHSVVFVVGMCMALIVTVYAATSYESRLVGYTHNNQETVEGALDDLYTKTNTMIDVSYFTNLGLDMDDIKMNSKKTMIASKSGILFKRSNGVYYYLKINNWAYEQNHIQQIFSGVTCSGVGTSVIDCEANDFNCSIAESGIVGCKDLSDNSFCMVVTVNSGALRDGAACN